jgi:hypothetical protein
MPTRSSPLPQWQACAFSSLLATSHSPLAPSLFYSQHVTNRNRCNFPRIRCLQISTRNINHPCQSFTLTSAPQSRTHGAFDLSPRRAYNWRITDELSRHKWRGVSAQRRMLGVFVFAGRFLPGRSTACGARSFARCRGTSPAPQSRPPVQRLKSCRAEDRGATFKSYDANEQETG